MKILVLTSSFRKKGNTARLVDLLNSSLSNIAQQAGIEVEIQTIDLTEANLTFCHGCRVCFDKGETHCPYWDEIAPIKTALQNADVCILASPVYVDDVNGVMKNFLDRMAHVNHRPEFAGKYAYLLTTSGTGSSGHAAQTMANTLRTWGVYIVGQKDFVCGGLSTRNQMEIRFGTIIQKTALKIIEAYHRQKALTPSVVAFIFFTVQQKLWLRHADDSIDYRYWQEKGWLKPATTYYLPHKSSFLKVLPARLAGSIIALFFQ